MLQKGIQRYGWVFAAGSVLALAACGGGGGEEAVAPPAKLQEFAAKVSACGAGDQPETALQGQVPSALRQAGFTGSRCNMELVGQFQGEGGNWSSATFRDSKGNTCAYHSTASLTAFGTGTPVARVNPGVPVIDITDPTKPVRTTSLTTKAMMDPWESLRVNAMRQLLVADYGTNSAGGNGFDVYDLSGDCRSPQLLSSVDLFYNTGDPQAPTKEMLGHEGGISPDGLTYYVGDYTNKKYHAIDISVPARPKLIATFDLANSPIGKTPHGLSVSPDGNRMYGVAMHTLTPAQLADPNTTPLNGFLVLDTSEVQARKANPVMRLVSSTAFKDGSIAQHTIETKIGGKPYLVMVDEGGSAGTANTTSVTNACAAGFAPFPMARIYDMADEKKPVLVSKLGLETHDPKNCQSILPDVAGLNVFVYGSHYCSVDSRENATAMACSYFNSGIRVFDIRNPAQPKEIAYFNPPGVKTAMAGSTHPTLLDQWRSGGPDWCASRLDFDKARGLLTTMCQDNGLLVMKFKNGVWPFAETLASTLQN